MYRLTDAEKRSIKEYEYEWDEPKLKYLKYKIKSSLIQDPLNDNICYYCKSPLDCGTTPGDIEHIVHKGKYEIFTYEPINLTLACDRCNTAKGSEDILITDLPDSYTEEDYPLHSDAFKIIHAHIDLYEEYIQIQDYIFFVGIDQNNKGENTIKCCNLNRLDLALSKIKQVKSENTVSSPVKKMINGIVDSKKTLQEIEKVFERPSHEEIFEVIINLNKDLNAIKIVNQLSKIDGLETNLVPDKINEFKKFITCLEEVEAYYKIIVELHKKQNFLSQLMGLPLKDDVIIPNIGKLFLNRRGLQQLKDELSTREFRYLQKQSKTVLLTLLQELLDSYDLSNVEALLPRLNIIMLVMQCVTDIYKDKTIIELLPGLNPTLVRTVSQDAERILPYECYNSQISIMFHMKSIYEEIFSNWDKVVFNKSKVLARKINHFINK